MASLPVPSWDVPPEVRVDPLVVLRRGQAPPTHEAGDVRVNRPRVATRDEAQPHIRGLRAHPGEPKKHLPRHLRRRGGEHDHVIGAWLDTVAGDVSNV